MRNFLKSIMGKTEEVKEENVLNDYQGEHEPDRFLALYDFDLFEIYDVIDIKKDGNPYKRFSMRPLTNAVAIKNKISESDIDPVSRRINKDFPAEYCFCMNISPLNQKWFISCDWEGNPKDIGSKMVESLRKSLTMERDKNKKLRIQMTELRKIMTRMSNEPDYMFDNVLKKMEKLKKISEDDDEVPVPQQGFGPMIPGAP